MKASTLRFVLGFVTALVCGAAGGFFFGQQSNRDRTGARAPQASNTDLANQQNSKTAQESAAAESSAPASPHSNPAATAGRIPDQFGELLDIDSRATRAYRIEQLFEAMTLEEAPDILTSILAVDNARERSQLLRPFFERWGRLDGQGAVAKAQELVGREKRSAVSAAMTGWARNDPYAAWETAREWVPGASPYTAGQFNGVITELAKRDLDAALEAYELADNRWSRSRFQYALMQAAFDTDQVPTLMNKALALDDSDGKEQWISNIFRRWGETDTGEPLDAMQQLSDPEMAKKAMEGFLQGWMQADPTGAIDYAIANHEDPLVSDAISPLMGSAFFQGTREDQLDLAARIAEAGLLDKAAPRMISTIATSNPELALHMASLVSDQDHRETFTQSAIANWAYSDFDGAAAYYNQMPTSDLKTKTLRSLAWRAMQREDGASQIAAWMQEVPAGKERTKLVESLLAGAVSPYTTPKPEFLAALKDIAAGETELSEDAIKHRDKLFGEKEAGPPPAP